MGDIDGSGSVSTHDLTKRSTWIHKYDVHRVAFQLTTSRRGRRKRSGRSISILVVSTHDLTKRSTGGCTVCNVKIFNVSTHDLTKRSTNFAVCNLWNVEFQLTTSRRGRRTKHGYFISSLLVSTHDLTKRSTWLSPTQQILHRSFNSRPHEEVDDSSASFPSW